jgi:hypothetical protein
LKTYVKTKQTQINILTWSNLKKLAAYENLNPCHIKKFIIKPILRYKFEKLVKAKKNNKKILERSQPEPANSTHDLGHETRMTL